MCEVTNDNFEELFPEIQKALAEARFVSVDLEFSCLTGSDKLQNSMFDSGGDRYKKIRETVEQMVPFQVGLTAFSFNGDNYGFAGRSYTFYVLPASNELFDKRFLCQPSSLQFLVEHGFDFNKLIYSGIPYLNVEQEAQLIEYLKNDDADLDSTKSAAFDGIIEEHSENLSQWFYKAKDGDTFVLSNKYKPNIVYMLHKRLRPRFNNRLWTYTDDRGFVIQKVCPETYKLLSRKCNVDQIVLDYMLGFTKIFRLLKTSQKPLIGHNLLHDLMVMTHHFHTPLPKSYRSFKSLITNLFPVIYDTKHLSFEVFRLLAEEKRWRHNTLPSLYEYFKDGPGRHLAFNSPPIECLDSPGRFHNAGWDSFCTGYIFIRMAHKFAADNCVKGKKFVPKELFTAVERFKNKVNVVRANIMFIDLDGEDPESQRPPRFIVESKTNRPVNIDQVTSILSAYGFIEVRPHSYKGRRVIVAVDNFRSAKRILSHFPSQSGYKIQQYNFFRHSPIVGNILWCGLLLSGAGLALLGYSGYYKAFSIR